MSDWMSHYQQRLLELLTDETQTPASVITTLKADPDLTPISDYLEHLDENQIELAGRVARMWVNKRDT